MTTYEITSLDSLLSVLPDPLANCITQADPKLSFMEIVLDLQRPVMLRWVVPVKSYEYLNYTIQKSDIMHIVNALSEFGEDGRVGIDGTLHRIACVKDKFNSIVGFTIRIGYPYRGSVELIQDLIDQGESLLILGPVASGKTSLLRQVAARLAEKGSTIIVDKSSEIGGEGTIPHPAVGLARRFQIPPGKSQADILLMALESHYPQCLVVDEVSNFNEAEILRTISQRGVQTIATAHGYTLSDLLSNPPLVGLLGGINKVTLGDEEAARRHTSKTVRERESPSPFHAVVELHSFDQVGIYRSIDTVIDVLLNGGTACPEIRRILDGQIVTLQGARITKRVDEREKEISLRAPIKRRGK